MQIYALWYSDYGIQGFSVIEGPEGADFVHLKKEYHKAIRSKDGFDKYYNYAHGYLGVPEDSMTLAFVAWLIENAGFRRLNVKMVEWT